MVRGPAHRLLGHSFAWIERLDTTESFLEDTVWLLNERLEIFDESFLV